MDSKKRGSQKEKVLDIIIGSFVHSKEKLSLSLSFVLGTVHILYQGKGFSWS